MKRLQPTLFVLLPFAAGYYLSYLFRVINAVIAKPLVDDLALDASGLGLLTALYFLTFAAVQLPLGAALDRFGVRRVQGALLMLAAVGSAIFAIAPGLPTLAIGRCLIGIGVAGALIGGLKAIATAFPKEQLFIVRGVFVACGAAGAVTATEPAAWLVAWLDWRGVFLVLSAATAVVAAATLSMVADPPVRRSPAEQKAVDILNIYRDADFWRVAPISALCIGAAWAMQGLWAALWFADVAMLERATVVHHLFVMACALCAGALFLGICAQAARRRGIGADQVLAVAIVLFLAAELALVLRLPVPSSILWGLVGAMGAATVLSYGIIGDLFPPESLGRANAALNILHIGAAFAIQCGMGLIVSVWSRDLQGHYPPAAYDAAVLVLIGLQLPALLWFLHSEQRVLVSRGGR
jgi:MFS family permease